MKRAGQHARWTVLGRPLMLVGLMIGLTISQATAQQSKKETEDQRPATRVPGERKHHEPTRQDVRDSIATRRGDLETGSAGICTIRGRIEPGTGICTSQGDLGTGSSGICTMKGEIDPGTGICTIKGEIETGDGGIATKRGDLEPGHGIATSRDLAVERNPGTLTLTVRALNTPQAIDLEYEVGQATRVQPAARMANPGGLATRAGDPVPGINVGLELNAHGGTPRRGTTGPDGTVTFQNLRPGPYLLAWNDGFGPRARIATIAGGLVGTDDEVCVDDEFSSGCDLKGPTEPADDPDDPDCGDQPDCVIPGPSGP